MTSGKCLTAKDAKVAEKFFVFYAFSAVKKRVVVLSALKTVRIFFTAKDAKVAEN
jgi:hypothetical protein